MSLHPVSTAAPLASAATDDPHARWSRRALLASGAAAAAGIAASGGIAAASAPPDSGAPSGGFGSAEQAMDAYLDALAAAEFDGAAATFAVEPYVANFDLAASLDRLGAYVPFNSPLPATSEFNLAINAAQRRGEVATIITNQYYALVNPTLERAQVTPLTDDGDVDEFVASLAEAMTPDPLVSLATRDYLTLEAVDAEAAERYSRDEAVAIDANLMAVLGADELAQLAVQSTIGGDDVVVLMRAIRYGDAWWMEGPYSQFVALIGLEQFAAGILRLGPAATGATAPVTTG